MVENRKGCVLGLRRCNPTTTAQEIHCQWRHDAHLDFQTLARRARAQAAALARKTDGFSETLSIELFKVGCELTGNLRPLAQLCRDLGGVFVPLPAAEATDQDVYAALVTVVEEIGQDSSLVRRVLADGYVTEDEVIEAEREIDQTIASAVALKAAIRAKVAKPSLLTSARVLA